MNYPSQVPRPPGEEEELSRIWQSPAADMGELRPDGAVGLGAAHGMAGAAAAGDEGFAPCHELRDARLDRRLLLAQHPGRELWPRQDGDLEGHQPVLETAELSALAAQAGGLAAVEGEPVRVAGDQVHLAGEARDPEAVDHVSGRQQELDPAMGLTTAEARDVAAYLYTLR